jgi:hypothetical protein
MGFMSRRQTNPPGARPGFGVSMEVVGFGLKFGKIVGLVLYENNVLPLIKPYFIFKRFRSK